MEKTQKTNNKKIIIAVIALCLVVALALTAYFLLIPRGVEGEKTITFEVIVDDELVTSVVINTDALYLRQALEEAGLVTPDEGSMIETVYGITADGTDGAWWIFTQNGQWLDFGADDQPIKDGEVYELTHTIFDQS